MNDPEPTEGIPKVGRGGWRPRSGRKPKAPPTIPEAVAAQRAESIEYAYWFLVRVMRSPKYPLDHRMAAALKILSMPGEATLEAQALVESHRTPQCDPTGAA